jgi:hypothetical protein
MKNGENYGTTDLYLASFLKARGMRLLRTEREGRRATFVFQNRIDREDLLRDFYNDGQIQINAFVHAMQDLKAVVYNW